jgi:hypothetical protein
MVVIEYRHDVHDGSLDRLAVLQHVVPNATLLAPSDALRMNQISVAAYGRQLRCPLVTRPTLDAVRLFRGRYLGLVPRHSRG